MKKKLLTITLFSIFFIQADSPSYAPKFSGYIKSEYWFDSRQVQGLRDNEYHIFPLAKVCDAAGQDINAVSSSNASIIQSRARVEFSAPDVHNITPKGFAEVDFFGIGTTFPVVRPRHLYATLSQNHLTFLAGHTWQPLFTVDCYPDTVNFNTGAPIEVFGRQPQLRVALTNNHFEWLSAALWQVETHSNGPVGPSSQYLRNGFIPNLHTQCLYKTSNGSVVGAGVDFLHITPRLVTDKNFYAQEHVNAVRAIVFGKAKYKKYEFKLKGIYAQNAHDLVMLGGYGVTYIDPVTDHRTYTPTRTVSVWSEFVLKKQLEPGIFIGWSKNLGTSKPIIQSIGDTSLLYTRGSNIDTLIRISPRARWYLNPCVIACELEYTRATYGTITDYARPCNTYAVGNIRFMAAVYYTF